MNPRLAPATLALLVALAGCATAPAASTQAPAPAVTAASVATAAERAGAPAPAKRDLSPTEFADLVAQPGVIVLDVRTPGEFASGHLQGAQNIDVEASDFDTRIAALPKDATYAVYCRSGNRSGVALSRMQAAGLTDAAHLAQGINSWRAAGLPIVT